MTLTLRSRITADAQELRSHGEHPTRLYLTAENAICLQYELISQGGPLAHKIMLSGLRPAVSEIDGLKIIWKSTRFEIA